MARMRGLVVAAIKGLFENIGVTFRNTSKPLNT
jgi:hypothetical protein